MPREIDISPAAFTVDAVQTAVEKEQEAKDTAPKKDKETERVLQNFEKSLQKTQTAALRVETERAKAQVKDDAKKQQDAEEAKKKPIIAKINRYLAAFPNLAGVVPKISTRASLQEVQEVLNIIREEIASQRSLYQLHKYVNTAFVALETTWKNGSGAPSWVPPQMRLNLTNMSMYYRQGLFDKEIEPVLMEIDIEYPWLGRQSLIWRTLEAFTEALTKTHIINSDPEAAQILMQKGAKDIPDLEKL
eukprot:m51a1_g10615 hypothetical protein (247) ;mRNA; f:50269-51009